MTPHETIVSGRAVLGIEFGSTRIKAVLIDDAHLPIAQGEHEWENHLVGGLWTYSLDDIWSGLRACYADLHTNVQRLYNCEIEHLAAIGISAMMHGYMAFDAEEQLLVPFRTWRNTNTGKAANELSELWHFNIPLRWSIAHLYQAMLDEEAHVARLRYLTTLAGYVHWRLTGSFVLGIGDASGMLPIDADSLNYNSAMMRQFEQLVVKRGYTWSLEQVLPRVLAAGEHAGCLTVEGAALLDPEGHLCQGVPFCPPEGDAGTGMVATNAVRPRTGNVSAGTSSFSMIVLEKPLSRPYEAIDIVTTPSGAPVAMVHCNNCTSDINAWADLFRQWQQAIGGTMTNTEVYTQLFSLALHGDPDCGGLIAYNFISGEPIISLSEGVPLLLRKPTGHFNLANFIRALLYGAIVVLKIGNDILFDKEHVRVNRITAHGGYFKTPLVGQRILAAALNSPITVMQTAGEGGAWGIALLAQYTLSTGLSLPDWLDEQVFHGDEGDVVNPTEEEVEGFNRYKQRYFAALSVEQEAVRTM